MLVSRLLRRLEELLDDDERCPFADIKEVSMPMTNGLGSRKYCNCTAGEIYGKMDGEVVRLKDTKYTGRSPCNMIFARECPTYRGKRNPPHEPFYVSDLLGNEAPDTDLFDSGFRDDEITG